MSTQKYEFKSKVLERKPCLISMEVEIEPSQTNPELDKVYNSIQKTAKIAGFRTGKVPMDMVKKNYSEFAREKLIENVIGKSIFNVLEQEKFIPLDMPVITKMEYDFGKVLKYSFKAECQPDFTAKDYKGIKVSKKINKITDKKVDEEIKMLQDRNASLVVSEKGEAAKDSFVIVSYEGFIDGKAVEKIKAKEFMIDLGAENTLKGFKDGLTGSKKGETKDIEIEYPKDYLNKELAGKKVTFKTKIEEIKDKKLPEANDDFAKDLGLENLEDLKKKIKESLEKEEVKRQNAEVENKIIEHLLDKNVFDVPESVVLSQKNYLIKRMSDYMKQQGAKEDFIKKQVESSDKKYAEEANKSVRLAYILNSVCSQEKLDVTDEDLNAEKQEMLDANSARKDDVENYFKENKENIASFLKEEKIFKFLKDNADITETDK